MLAVTSHKIYPVLIFLLLEEIRNPLLSPALDYVLVTVRLFLTALDLFSLYFFDSCPLSALCCTIMDMMCEIV